MGSFGFWFAIVGGISGNDVEGGLCSVEGGCEESSTDRAEIGESWSVERMSDECDAGEFLEKLASGRALGRCTYSPLVFHDTVPMHWSSVRLRL